MSSADFETAICDFCLELRQGTSPRLADTETALRAAAQESASACLRGETTGHEILFTFRIARMIAGASPLRAEDVEIVAGRLAETALDACRARRGKQPTSRQLWEVEQSGLRSGVAQLLYERAQTEEADTRWLFAGRADRLLSEFWKKHPGAAGLPSPLAAVDIASWERLVIAYDKSPRKAAQRLSLVVAACVEGLPAGSLVHQMIL